MPILQLNDVSKSFSALKVADAVTFDLSEGEALGIIGPNGAGKSTMERSDLQATMSRGRRLWRVAPRASAARSRFRNPSRN
jgi:ABC-type branched-subunit amino acid transport system ATPase component